MLAIRVLACERNHRPERTLAILQTPIFVHIAMIVVTIAGE